MRRRTGAGRSGRSMRTAGMRADMERIGELQGEVKRKEKALVEAAALLVLLRESSRRFPKGLRTNDPLGRSPEADGPNRSGLPGRSAPGAGLRAGGNRCTHLQR